MNCKFLNKWSYVLHLLNGVFILFYNFFSKRIRYHFTSCKLEEWSWLTNRIQNDLFICFCFCFLWINFFKKVIIHERPSNECYLFTFSLYFLLNTRLKQLFKNHMTRIRGHFFFVQLSVEGTYRQHK